MLQEATHTDLPEFGVAHATDTDNATGVTVFICPEGASCGVDVRGGGPATRETDLLRPENMVQDVNAVILSGGSAFGLEAACGVMEEMAARDIGFQVGPTHVPIIPGASLFDLLIGRPVWPDKEMGRSTCRLAFDSMGTPPEMGNVGAGTGATVGKMGRPEQAMKSGFGWSGVRLGEVVVIANVAVNAAGNVMDENGAWLAGVLGPNGIEDPFESALAIQAANSVEAINTDHHAKGHSENTTLGCILTNAALTKAQCTKVAQIAQDAYARAIKPVHTTGDGDTIFVMASGKTAAPTDVVAIMATQAMEEAIRNAVRSAEGMFGLKSAKDIA